MKTTQLQDVSIIIGLKNKDNQVIRMIYTEYYTMVEKLVRNFSGKPEDAEDIFQDAMVIIYRKIRDDELKLTCSFKTYLFAICRNLAMQKFARPGIRLTSEFNDNKLVDDFNPDEDFSEQEKYNLFQRYFLKLPADCQKVISLFLSKKSLPEITEIMGFSSVDYTKTRKYLCKEALKKNILNDPFYRKHYA